MQNLRIPAKQEEEKQTAKEKEAAELEAKRKIQECLNIEEKSIPQASTRSRKLRIDPTLSNFTISTKRILLSDFEISPVTPNVKTVNSLSMGDKHLDTSKDSLESSVRDPIPIPSESNDTSNDAWDSLLNDDKFQRALNDWCNLIQQNSKLSIYDENNKIKDCYKHSHSAITPDLPIPDSLIMEDEHLDTIPITESVNTIKSSVEDLVLTPSESADLSSGESKCDMPINDDSPESHFLTFDNPLFPTIRVIDDDDFKDVEYVSLEEVNDEKEFDLEDIFQIQDIEPDLGGLTSIAMNNNLTNYPLLELSEFESFHFDPSFPRPPPKPPDVEICLHSDPDAPVIDNFNELNNDQWGSEIDFSQNVKDDDSFTFVIQTFLPFLTYPADFPLLLSTGSEDTIFDPGIST
ncbi:hypothetical protein Tco_1315627 [Tanacetum coccineum]